MPSWTEEQHVQDTQQERSAVLLDGEGGIIFIYSSFTSLQPQRDSGRSAPARDGPDLPESPAELGAGGARKAELLAGVSHRSPGLRGPGCVPAMAPGHLGSTSPNQRTLAALSPRLNAAACVVLPNHPLPFHSSPRETPTIPVLEVQAAPELPSRLLPAPRGHCQPCVATASPVCLPPAPRGPRQALRLLWLWLWLEEPLAQESRNSDAWAGGQGLGRCQADSQTPGRLHGAGR